MSEIVNALKRAEVDQLMEVCREYDNNPGELINILRSAQSIFGYLPAEVQEIIARQLKIPVSQVYGVVSFYPYFTMIPRGKNPISLCTGTACHVRGADKVLNELKRHLKLEVGETSPDGNFSLNCLGCIGACGLAPVMIVGDKTYGRVSTDQVKEILKEYGHETE